MGYDPDQPRDEKGEWTNDGGGTNSIDPSNAMLDTLRSLQSNANNNQFNIPKPEIVQKMGQSWLEGICQYIGEYGPKDNKDKDKKEVTARLERQLEKNGIAYIDAYHVTDMESPRTGIHGSRVSSTGETGNNARESSVYVFLDPDDIHTGYSGILGAHNAENNVMHIKIPVDQLKNMRWDSNFNMTFGTYSAARIPRDVPSKWIAGVYKYRDSEH